MNTEAETVALGDPVAPVRPKTPGSPPTPVASPEEEGETGGEQERVQAVTPALGRFRDAEKAREAGRISAAARRADTRTEAEVLREALKEQVSIATSRAKGTTPAARTAAAALIPKLQEALRDAEERERTLERIPWETMPPEHLALMRHVLDAGDDDVVACLVWWQERALAHAQQEERQGDADPPPPRE